MLNKSMQPERLEARKDQILDRRYHHRRMSLRKCVSLIDARLAVPAAVSGQRGVEQQLGVAHRRRADDEDC